ncbi:MAG: phospholipase D-like domain-containing protein [Methanomassiliicoccaceae archaeon]|nr:phospholipase D-like domain-containing protein [Methanomassiliicoccaceae archaeon]
MRTIATIIVLSFLITAPAALTGDAAGDSKETILFYEVYPFGSTEGVSLHNYGDSNVNMKGWSLTDREGTLTFVKDVMILPGARLTVAKTISPEDWFSGRDNVIAMDDPCFEKKGSFIVADAGDDVYLCKGTALIDAVCYGNKLADSGWKGDPCSLSSGKYLLRIGTDDTDSKEDWIATKPGLTNNPFDPEIYFDADVTPFSFPESFGIPIFKEMEKAEKEILIANYLFTNVQLAALLCDLSKKGVVIRILLEGDVLGVDMSTELTLMKSLADAGVHVYLINDKIPGNYERYSFFHNKYAVIDGKKVIVTSENWTQGNLSINCSNRGWGVVIQNEDLADYVKEMFFSDLNFEHGDVHTLMQSYPTLKPYHSSLTYTGFDGSYETSSFNARVWPFMSPDNSGTAMKYFIDGAETRVYAEQMDIGSSFSQITEASPLGWMSSAAGRGVDTKLILDSSNTDREEIINRINFTSEIKAISVNGKETFSLIHNKGLIIDDTVWIGSVNWTETSFKKNREFAVLIDSKEVAEFFAELFIEDWGVNEHTIEEFGLEIAYEIMRTELGMIHVFTVSGPEDSSYTWDVLGNGTLRRSSINSIVCKDLKEGAYTVTVTMDGTSYSASYDYVVEPLETPPSENKTNMWIPAGAGIAALAGAGLMVIRRNFNR